MKPAVVYVDDEEILCDLFEMSFCTPDCLVKAFSDPAHALDYIESNPVCLIICDFRMPQMSGLDFLAAVKKEIPFYLLTGDLSFSTEVVANSRISGILYKPLDDADLSNLISSHCSDAQK